MIEHLVLASSNFHGHSSLTTRGSVNAVTLFANISEVTMRVGAADTTKAASKIFGSSCWGCCIGYVRTDHGGALLSSLRTKPLVFIYFFIPISLAMICDRMPQVRVESRCDDEVSQRDLELSRRVYGALTMRIDF